MRQKKTKFWITVGHKGRTTFELIRFSKIEIIVKSCGVEDNIKRNNHSVIAGEEELYTV